MDIKLQINGKPVCAKEGETVMEAASAAGVHIPHFCWHPQLSIAANCRMCLVEVEKSPKPLPACATPAVDGMVVHTASPAAKKAQNGVMEFLLINHPLDCPICDQGGECQLQDLAVGYGVSHSRYAEEKRVVFEKALGPLIATDMTRCIHCTRCVRFGREVAGIMELGLIGRGEHAEIMPFVEKTVESELSGNMIDVCPVGALTSKPFRFSARPWELQKKPGIAAHDAWGSNILWECKGAQVKRVVPRANDDINECWISDRDRFSYLALDAKDRGKNPMHRAADANRLVDAPWMRVLDDIADKLKNTAAADIGFLASPNATLEELFLLKQIARGLGCDNTDYRLRRRDFDGGNLSAFGADIGELRTYEHLFLAGVQPAAELPLLAALLRKRRRRLSLSSLGAVECGLPGRHLLLRPSQWAHSLDMILRAANGDDIGDNGDDNNAATAAEIGKTIAAKKTAILFGGGAEQSPHYSALLARAGGLAQRHGAKLGILSGGANGAGAAKVGFMPNDRGLNTAQMLRGKLRVLVLYQCEPEDFAEQTLLKRALAKAEYVIVINTHIGGARYYARAFLPMAAAAETDGTFINGEGRKQSFAAAVKPPFEAREGWKILRLLGEKLGIKGFDFSSAAAIKPELREEDNDQAAAAEVANTDDANAADDERDGETFELANYAAIYDADALTRRSEPLQKTAAGKNAARALMHPVSMQKIKVQDGDAVRFSDGEGGATVLPVFADSRIAAGVVVARAEGLLQTRGIIAERAEEKAPARAEKKVSAGVS
ncbi:MAG: NADH-quinone oxidoreductase subunit NuoG [Gammaproteobacteria bacterium]